VSGPLRSITQPTHSAAAPMFVRPRPPSLYLKYSLSCSEGPTKLKTNGQSSKGAIANFVMILVHDLYRNWVKYISFYFV